MSEDREGQPVAPCRSALVPHLSKIPCWTAGEIGLQPFLGLHSLLSQTFTYRKCFPNVSLFNSQNICPSVSLGEHSPYEHYLHMGSK